MGTDKIASQIDSMLEDGFHGSASEFTEVLEGEGIDAVVGQVEKALSELKISGEARRSPGGHWYRTGKILDQKPRPATRSAGSIGGLQRRLIYVPALCPDSLVLLTVREGTGAFRIRSYSPGAARAKMISVAAANNDIAQLEKLHGPFKVDITWKDSAVQPVDAVDYWYEVISKLNKEHVPS